MKRLSCRVISIAPTPRDFTSRDQWIDLTPLAHTSRVDAAVTVQTPFSAHLLGFRLVQVIINAQPDRSSSLTATVAPSENTLKLRRDLCAHPPQKSSPL
jgi:hypothetical protein